MGKVPLLSLGKPTLMRWFLREKWQDAARKAKVYKKRLCKAKRIKRLEGIIGFGAQARAAARLISAVPIMASTMAGKRSDALRDFAWLIT